MMVKEMEKENLIRILTLNKINHYVIIISKEKI